MSLPPDAAPAAAQAWFAPALADEYELRRELGAGGMATVWLALDRRHEREVAIKVMHPELAASVGADRFLREIRLVARLQHPHILPLFDSGRGAGGVLWFAMPLVDGESLRGRLQREGALAFDDAVRLVRQLADALDYAHARGVVHRDLKPENVLLAGAHALLADFGVARGPDADGGDGAPDALTSVGMTLGTPTYMSPEQALADRALDGRSDVYSLGCVCYEAIAGQAPFAGANAYAIIRQHLASPPPPLRAARGTLPAGAEAAVVRALAKDPDDRFATAGAFAEALERAAADARQPSRADAGLRVTERQQAARTRVLVLEFANIARAADADWLSTGIAETVAADLGKIAGVQVVGQDTTSRRRIESAVAGRTVDPEVAAEVGGTVGARWVVWGAFQKAGPRVRITPHYLDTAGAGASVGGEKIDGLMDDIFELQDRIVTGLARAMRIELTSSEVAGIARPETADLGAYEHYARGYRAYLEFGKASAEAGSEHFRAAIALDPDYALAHAGLGVIQMPRYIASGDPAVLAEGVRHLERAVALDPSIGEAYALLAYMHFRRAASTRRSASPARASSASPGATWGGTCSAAAATAARWSRTSPRRSRAPCRPTCAPSRSTRATCTAGWRSAPSTRSAASTPTPRRCSTARCSSRSPARRSPSSGRGCCARRSTSAPASSPRRRPCSTTRSRATRGRTTCSPRS
jgi:serine/threonine-protein kinase